MNGTTVGLVAVGGAVGSVLRVYVANLMGGWTGEGQFPWATLIVNVVGTAILACVVAWGFRGEGPSNEFRALIAAGFCGGLTTFSTFSVEAMLLWTQGARTTSVLYVVASFAASLAVIAIIWTLWPTAKA